ncbi:Glycosyltransferase involved in cell wall bisynthesis [Franzmannia pantelleriensis]|uniref:Glycosyltransferase involved in cell wall bisynthesis n=1 Tax=Franzmannia pantelleriensis TaxID=48727 RepID=A0A1G9EE34_9GAMM|nr:glycosyltransferase family 4 protein [Halomonas pantelleriensis]SDK74374.1 Glycosyltransferase involved in cell wall bisynthesis [Halomonas pantelleriensis]
MRILFLSFYYPPDLSAGSFRASSLVKALLERLPETAHIEVITTSPNRYLSFSQAAKDGVPAYEQHPGLTIHRVALPEHQSGMRDQSRAFYAYAREALRISRGHSYDMVYATSSRLMTASLGAWLSRRLKAPLYLDIRDIFVDTLKDVLPSRVSWLAKPIFGRIEKWTLRQAKGVNLVSEGFLEYFEPRYPGRRFSLYTNGIDEEFLRAAPITTSCREQKPLSVVYAGNMGEGQGLHEIVPELAKRLEGRAHFILIGDGGRRPHLEAALAKAHCTNVEVRDPVPRDQLIKLYQQADVLFLHLNDYPAFRKVLPSKLFEYGALGKPILAGVSGYAARFIEKHLDNAQVFPPCDVDRGESAFTALSPETAPRETFTRSFARHNIMLEMAQDVLAVKTREKVS